MRLRDTLERQLPLQLWWIWTDWKNEKHAAR